LLSSITASVLSKHLRAFALSITASVLSNHLRAFALSITASVLSIIYAPLLSRNTLSAAVNH
jgi:hypothetical protein